MIIDCLSHDMHNGRKGVIALQDRSHSTGSYNELEMLAAKRKSLPCCFKSRVDASSLWRCCFHDR